MLRLSYRLLNSKIFTFMVGENQTPIVVHSAAISALSEPLDRLINGDMREAQEACACLRDLEPEDFERICEFAYRGDYPAPKPVEIESSEHGEINQNGHGTENIAPIFSEPPASSNSTSLLRGLVKGAKGKEKEKGQTELATAFRERQYMMARYSKMEYWSTYAPIQVSASQDFGPIFLAYARIYAFAEQWMVNKLKELTLKKLHDTLVSILGPLSVSDRNAIMGLARFAYDNDYIPDRGTTIKIDALRELIVEFMVIHVGDMRFCSDHELFLAEEGEYARDLMAALHQWRL
jgi:hypothetical protein